MRPKAVIMLDVAVIVFISGLVVTVLAHSLLQRHSHFCYVVDDATLLSLCGIIWIAMSTLYLVKIHTISTIQILPSLVDHHEKLMLS